MTCRGCSPFLFLLVHGDAARSQGHHHQEAADHGKGLKYERRLFHVTLVLAVHLEEVVFEEVSHGFICGDGPPGVEVEVEDVEPRDQHQGGQLRLVADSDQDHQERPDQVLDNL